LINYDDLGGNFKISKIWEVDMRKTSVII